MSNRTLVAASIACAVLIGCNRQEPYVRIYSTTFQTFLDRATLLRDVEAEADRRGFKEHPKAINQSGYGVTLFKSGYDLLFQFHGTEGVSCYLLVVFARNEQIAKQNSQESQDMVEVIISRLGRELRYSGSGPCPNVTHNKALQATPDTSSAAFGRWRADGGALELRR